MRLHYTKKINDWDLDIEYNYIPAEDPTNDYPGYGSHIEIKAIYLWHGEIDTIDEHTNIVEFLFEFCPNVMKELETEIVDYYEDNFSN